MNYFALIDFIKKKKTFLCIGLDTDINLIPSFFLNCNFPLFAFNKAIIDETCDYCIAYKINTAFYESLGEYGWEQLKMTAEYIKENYSEILLIADAKRSDVFHSSVYYAKAFFENLPFDAITINPYLGYDTISPFLNYKDKFFIILALTSNKSATDFQLLKLENGKYLFEKVIEKSLEWSSYKNIMYVVGATKVEFFKKVRELAPLNFLLVPGLGFQGGELESVIKYGANENFGLILNYSRTIIYSSSDENFAKKAKEIAKNISNQIWQIYSKFFKFI